MYMRKVYINIFAYAIIPSSQAATWSVP